MLKEAQWSAAKLVPGMDEYMSNGFLSFALGPIVLPTLYLIGPKLSEAAVRSKELLYMFELMSTCGRLLNDIQGFKVCVLLLIRGCDNDRPCILWNKCINPNSRNFLSL